MANFTGNTVADLTPLSGGRGQPSVPNFENERSEKKWVGSWGILKSPYHRYLPKVRRGLTMYLIKKDFVKWNMVFRAQFSNVNLGLFLPNNQIFSFVTFCLLLLNHLSNVTRNQDVEILQLWANFQTAMMSCSKLFGSQLPVTTGGFELRISCIRVL